MKLIDKKMISFILIAVMLCGTGAFAYAAGAKSNTPVKKADTATASSEKAEDTENNKASENSKDETVYVIADAEGSAKKVIVSDWINNASGQSSIRDNTELNKVTNVKGDESYKMDENNIQVWDAEGKDIYYQGDSNKELPVDIAVSYRLDGQTISAEELAGKSGRVTIRYDYTNKQYEDVVIDGVKTKTYVPFVMLTGMILDNEKFTDIQVTNGKIVNDGDRTMVIGIALPGMQENLNLDTHTLEIPQYVEISADVTSFELTTTLTLASNEVFNEINLDKVDSFDSLSDSMKDLSNAMTELIDGSSKLYDGLSTLLDKSKDLIDGIGQLAEGSKQLSEGAGTVRTGAEQLQTGIESLSSGLERLTSNNDSLNGGAKQVFESMLSMADAKLAEAGLSVKKLTMKNYAAVLSGVQASLNETSLRDLAYKTALKSVTNKVREQESVIQPKVEASVHSKVLEGVLKAAGQSMTVEEYQAAVTAGKISSELQAKITAAVDKQMKSEDIQGQINTNTEAQIQSLISQNMKSSDVTSQIDAAVESAKSGAQSISGLKAQLDSYNEFYQGLRSYTAGVEQADTGAGKLVSGSKKLAAGTVSLSNGANSLYSGLNTLKDGCASLVDGVSQLKEGAMQLSDGLTEFSDKGIQKLVDAFDGDLSGLVTRLRATIDVSKNYNSFAGKSSDMDGKVKFIYRTDSIGE